MKEQPAEAKSQDRDPKTPPDQESPLAYKGLPLQHRFLDRFPSLCEAWIAKKVPKPEWVVRNDELIRELGLEPDFFETKLGVEVFTGARVLAGSEPVATAYSGHQFGHFSPVLGDGRAVLLGELEVEGRLFDVHLKGSGRTGFARGGDGKAVLGPMLREYLVAEALEALGVPTNRALGVTRTGDFVRREKLLPGAVLTRIAPSFLRVGTFEYAARRKDLERMQALVDEAIFRHYPELEGASDSAFALFQAVAEAQAELIAQWMGIGFLHGVMNTDNMAIGGISIDFGPCAFLDRYDPSTVFSSIDRFGRYAYGNQPGIARWNLARLAEALLPLFDPDQEVGKERAMQVLDRFPDRYQVHFQAEFAKKLGLGEGSAKGEQALGEEFLQHLEAAQADFTLSFRSLSKACRGDPAELDAILAKSEGEGAKTWRDRWEKLLDGESRSREEIALALDRKNPLYIPRNHLVDRALKEAEAGDLARFQELVEVLKDPFRETPGKSELALPAPEGFTESFRTFCGT